MQTINAEFVVYYLSPRTQADCTQKMAFVTRLKRFPLCGRKPASKENKQTSHNLQVHRPSVG